MTIDPGAAYTIAAAIVLLLGVVIKLSDHRAKAALKAAQQVAQTAAADRAMQARERETQVRQMQDLITLLHPPDGRADQSGNFAMMPACGPACRDEVLKAVRGLAEKMDGGFDEVRREFRSQWKAITAHGERLVALETKAGMRRRRDQDEADSDRPGR